MFLEGADRLSTDYTELFTRSAFNTQFISNEYFELHIDITIAILDIIHRPVFYMKHISETTFCIRLQVEHTQLGPTNSVLSPDSRNNTETNGRHGC
jgi:hypothetical protein